LPKWPDLITLPRSIRDGARRQKMARLVVMYKTPKDAGGFDAYYFNTHVPIAKKIPGVRKYEVSKERWSRLSEQIFRVDRWSVCRVRLPS
jgi:hypothetical protein